MPPAPKFPFCGYAVMAERRVEHPARLGNRSVTMTGAPCQECASCGERLFEAAVLKRMEAFLTDHPGEPPSQVRYGQI